MITIDHYIVARVLLPVCLCCALCPSYLGEAKAKKSDAVEHAKALEAIRKLGGKIIRDNDLDGKPIIAVDLHGTKLANADLKAISSINTIQLLDLGNTEVTAVEFPTKSGH